MIDAFCMASRQVRPRLSWPETRPPMIRRARRCTKPSGALSGERILIIAADDPLLVNALQRRAAVVLQKSLREGFGLTVSEAMWKGRAVIGGDVGGIRHQIVDGHSGFLVSDVPQAAAQHRLSSGDQELRRSMGRRARERVRRHFLMTRCWRIG